MTAPINNPSVRGVGHPEMLRVDVTRNITDDVAVGGEVGAGPLGISGGAGYYTQFGSGAERFFSPTIGVTAGWSF